MSDEIAAPEPVEVQTPETPTVDAEPQGASETDWKKEARKWEARAKEAQTFKEQAEKWREYEQSQKSEHEKLAEKLASAEAIASEANAKLIRYEIASQKGIPADALDLLNGSTREELEVAADKLLSLIGEQTKNKLPMPDVNQGKPAPAAVGQLTKADLESMTPAEINKARAEGRLNELLGIQ
jgi:hypothetical protein